MSAQVLIAMGSDSDLPVMSEAAAVLDQLQVAHRVTIISAHRTPQRLFDIAGRAHDDGIAVVIAGAGGAAHLPGMIAAISPLPVVGVPIRSSKSIDGWDSMLSIVQMPPGVPVATVGIDGAKNAGILAAQILGATSAEVRNRVSAYKDELRGQVDAKIADLESLGPEDYLSKMRKRSS